MGSRGSSGDENKSSVLTTSAFKHVQYLPTSSLVAGCSETYRYACTDLPEEVH